MDPKVDTPRETAKRFLEGCRIVEHGAMTTQWPRADTTVDSTSRNLPDTKWGSLHEG